VFELRSLFDANGSRFSAFFPLRRKKEVVSVFLFIPSFACASLFFFADFQFVLSGFVAIL